MSASAEQNPSPQPPTDGAPASRLRLPVTIKLTLLLGLTLALLLGGLLTAGWFYWREVLRREVDERLGAIATSRRDLVKAQISLLRQRMALNVDRGEFRGLYHNLAAGVPVEEYRANALESLKRISDRRPIVGATLVDLDGLEVLSTRAETGRRNLDGAPFRAGLSGVYIGPPYWKNGRFESLLAAPIRSRSEPVRVYGVLLATADVSALADTLQDVTGLGASGEALLGVREGDTLRFLFPPRNAPDTATVPIAAAPALGAASEGTEAFFKNRDYRGVPVLAAGRPIGYGGWGLVVKMDAGEACAPATRALHLGLGFGLFVAALGLVAAYALARSFTRPVRRLAEAAARVAGGDYTSQVAVESADELGALTVSFNEMTAAIRARRAERDDAEQALRESEARSRQIAESLPQLVWTCTADGPCDYLSPQWVKYTGIAAAPQLGLGWLEQIHPEDRARTDEQWRAVAAAGSPLDIEFRIRRHDGAYRWFRTRAMPLKDERGRVVKWFGTNTDIDDTKRAEEARREADRRKDEFLAILGHELRNPLSGISNAVSLWQDAPGDAAAAGLARGIIERQTGNLSRLMDDLLDVARITEGKIELRKRPVEIGEAVNRALEAVRPLLEERRHQLDLKLAGAGKLRVAADPTRLEQIVTNLLTNAIKYTPDGGRITVVERREGRDAVLTVTDNGIGIAPEMIGKIFDLFTQADGSLDRTSGGLGLGLSLCRQLVALHGGAISAHSSGLGKGAAFTVRLPALVEHATIALFEPPAPAPRLTPGHRILLVDDNQDTVHSLSRLLQMRGHEVATSYDGLSALEVARTFQPDVFLLDIGLPGLDGYTLARRLRAEGFAPTLMIAISGYAQEADRQQARAAGFDHHFAKPIDFEVLAALLAAEPAPLRANASA